jgi:L-asparaginase
VLGTGGTIAGMSASAADNVGYLAARTAVGALVASLAASGGVLESEQVAQVGVDVEGRDLIFGLFEEAKITEGKFRFELAADLLC